MLIEQDKEQNTDQLHLGMLRVSMRMLKDLFQLPDDYQVAAVHIDTLANELRLVVSNSTLPEAKEFQDLPLLRPVYSRIEIAPGEYATRLTNITVETH